MSAEVIRKGLYRIVSSLGYGAHTEANNWLGEPAANDLREILKYDRYYRVYRMLSKYRSEDPDRYALYLAALSDWPGQPRFLDGWVWYASHIAEPWLVRGANAMKGAFDSRWADTQGVVGMHIFFRRLEQAERDFQKALEVDPENPEVYGYLIATGGALGISHEDLRQRFETLLAIAPEHFQGHSNMLIALYRKPEPNDNALFNFTRTVTDNAPHGSPLQALIPQAHIEKWAMLRFVDSPEKANAYFKEPRVWAEIQSAYNRLFNVPGYQPTALEPILAGYFAVAFYLAEDRQGLDDMMQRIGNYTTTYPWNHLCRKPREFLNVGYVIDRVRQYPHSMLF